MPKMTSEELTPILSAARASADAAMSESTLMQEREDSMNYYNGIMNDMPAMDGRSRAVSTDVADIIDGIMPQLVDVFVGGDQAVEFDPVGPEDEEAAQQETDYCNHVFMQQNNGYLTSHNFIKDGLLQKVGFVKVWWDTYEREERETYYGLSEDQYAMLMHDIAESDGEMKIVEHTENGAEEAKEPAEAGT